MKGKLTLVFCLLLFSGCRTDTSVFVVGNEELTEELGDVQKAFQSIESEDDKLTIHKLFSGGGEYLSVCETLQTTAQFDPLLGKVQTSYGWDREKYPELTDAVSEYLISVGYEEPKELKTSKDRRDFAKMGWEGRAKRTRRS